MVSFVGVLLGANMSNFTESLVMAQCANKVLNGCIWVESGWAQFLEIALKMDNTGNARVWHSQDVKDRRQQRFLYDAHLYLAPSSVHTN